MSQFERDLRESLRRREAPEGFAEKVLARTRASDSSKVIVCFNPSDFARRKSGT